MSNDVAPSIILDISRTVSRLSRGRITGIDRVEAEYIRFFLAQDFDVSFLARFKKQFAYLDKKGMSDFLKMATGDTPWHRRDALGIVGRDKQTGFVESSLRKLSVSWPKFSFGLRNSAAQNTIYINVGHSRLDPEFWSKINKTRVKKICLVHDIIPLSHPEYCTAQTTLRTAQSVEQILKSADHIIWNSAYSQSSTEKWAYENNLSIPNSTVIHLGANTTRNPISSAPNAAPYFLVIGTIEPRKNHSLLLDVWDQLIEKFGERAPKLYIVGGRGWMNEKLFNRLDSSPHFKNIVVETGYVSDAKLAELLQNARALLFPSFVEGFGFPLVDAMAAGVPVICSDIPVFKELGKSYPSYLDSQNIQAWRESIETASTQGVSRQISISEKPDFSTWDQHFGKLLTILKTLN